MASITGLTAARMLDIEAASVISGGIIGDDLILETHGGSTINAGRVRAAFFPVTANLPNISAIPGSAIGNFFINAATGNLTILGVANVAPGEIVQATSATAGTKTGSLRGPAGVGVEVGDLKNTMRTTPSTGWLFCDGQVYNNTQYPDLAALLGTAHGGVGGTSFAVPDYRGRVLVNKGTHTEVDALTDNDGLAVGSRKVKHRHGKGTLSASGGSHGHLTSAYTVEFAQGNNLWPGGTDTTGGSYVNHNAVQANTHSHPNSEFSGEVGDTAGPLDGPAYGVANIMIRALA